MDESWVCCRLECYLNDAYQRVGYVAFVSDIFPVASRMLHVLNLRMEYVNACGIRVYRRV